MMRCCGKGGGTTRPWAKLGEKRVKLQAETGVFQPQLRSYRFLISRTGQRKHIWTFETFYSKLMISLTIFLEQS